MRACLFIVTLALTACSSTDRLPPGAYSVVHYSSSGAVDSRWDNLPTVTQDYFPPSASFTDSSGRKVVVDGTFTVTKTK